MEMLSKHIRLGPVTPVHATLFPLQPPSLIWTMTKVRINVLFLCQFSQCRAELAFQTNCFLPSISLGCMSRILIPVYGQNIWNCFLFTLYSVPGLSAKSAQGMVVNRICLYFWLHILHKDHSRVNFTQ
jgi:hypothetical protein